MATRLRTACLLAASLLFSVGLSPAGARPADLPAKKPVVCPPQAAETLPPPVSSEEEETFETIDTLCPCLGEVLLQCWQKLLHSLSEKARTEPAGPTCPYLKQKAAPDNPVPDGLAGKQVSVLDNLDKLQKAKQLYDLAEYYRRTGHPGSACYYYKSVRELCPGSRYEAMATQQLNVLQARQTSETTSPAAEEQEGRPAPTPELPKPPLPEKRRRELLPMPAESQELESPWQRIWFSEPPSPGTPERVQGGILEDHLQPPLPPLDPKLVEALEKLLSESGDPAMPKLILQTESTDPGEEQEPDLGSGWLPVPTEEELPILLFFPEDPNEPPEAAEDDDEADDELIPEFVPDWNEVFREVIDAVSAGTCTEIDGSNLEHLRFLCQKQVGAITVRLFSDSDGVWHCMVVSLDPEAGSDLRAAQRAHNDRIDRWIESLSTNAGEDTLDDEDIWDDDSLEEEEIIPTA